jgi:hypothetical protein
MSRVRNFNDQLLLSLAAKAADFTPPEGWNPIVNPGQALMLAVTLRMHLGVEDGVVNAWSTTELTNFQTVIRAHFGDEAAACRAIVLCAAETGRRMA